MLFNLFGKKKQAVGLFKDRVYIGSEAKMNACLQLAKEKPETIFIAWFSDTAKLYKDFFLQHEADASNIILAREIHSGKFQNHSPVFLEHYPLQEKEKALVASWQQPILVYSSLDEPLFKHLGSDKVIPIVKMLGMKEDEPIEHAMVSKSIGKGQEKMASQVTIDQSAHSQKEWIEKNIK